MRLTLRTLLAYLDNTLDPQDAESLRIKLTESGFATQLVQRIRASLENPLLSAPPPDAAGPIEDANAISEYLDSTLPAEQVAEIERACLESDPHLAEAAACHQILTMVLGRPADVSPELRNRIYQLPDRTLDQIGTAASIASLELPTGPEASAPLADEIPTADATVNPIQPVGMGDSGVSDAPTRLREMGVVDEPASTSRRSVGLDPVLAGSRPRALTESQIYGGSIRPSRIAPWLVSLAVVAVLLFALAQIFAPLLSRDHTLADHTLADGEQSAPAVASEPSAIESGRAERDQAGGQPAPTATTPADEQASPPAAELPANAQPTRTDAGEDVATSVAAAGAATEQPADEASLAGEPAKTEPLAADMATAPATGDPGAADPAGEADAGSPAAAAPADREDAISEAPAPQPADAGNRTATAGSNAPPATDDLAPSPAAADPAPASPPQQPIGTLTSDEVLMSGWVDGQWQWLNQDSPVNSNSALVCAPTYRCELTTNDKLRTTMLGPAGVQWLSADDGSLALQVASGRLLLEPLEPDTRVRLVLGDEPVSIHFLELSDMAAVEVGHLRRPGFDPFDPESHQTERLVTAAQGTITLTAAEDLELTTGQQWSMRGADEATVTSLEQLPDWLQPAEESELSLEATARKELLQLLSASDQPLQMALRDATRYRKSEVAALAGQSLLSLGFSDVYFGGDGILNRKKQRAYWPDHFVALRRVLDQGGSAAESLRESIARMDSANGAAILALLIGYSQFQLEAGADLELVEKLDSPSMAVRVLALENLREITGTTAYFRADEENAVRRSQALKKWLARQRKGDIRWPE